jgi:RecA/RadA recombinase
MVKEEKTPEEKLREMLKTGEGWEDFKDRLKDVQVKCEIQPLSEGKEPEKILKTGTVLDDMFGGGLSAGQTVEIYGEFASGKSQILFTLIVEAASRGIVIVIDAEDTFSRKRILQIAQARNKDVNTVNNNIWLYKPDGWEEQLAIPSQLPDQLPSKLTLIVEDSLMCLFRSTPEFAGRSNLGKRQELIRWHLRQLKRIAKKENCIVVYTNQVYDEPVANPFLPDWASQMPCGGHSVAHVGDYRIFLRKGSGNIRIARLVDNSEIPPAERIFQINEKGIDDLPQEQQEEAKKREQTWEKKQQEALLTKKKKKKEGETEEVEPKEEETKEGNVEQK